MKLTSKLLVAAATAVALTVGATAAMAGAKIFVIGGKADDPFWSRVKKGAEDAGLVTKATGGTVTWLGPQNYDNLGKDAADLIRQAIAQKADAIVGPDWVPEAMDDAFKAVVAAKIPLVIYNAGGLAAADKLGASNYVGGDDYQSGFTAGTYFTGHGQKSAVCINTLPGAANLDAQCKGLVDGMAKGGGKGDVLPLPMSNFGNPTAVAQAVKAYLLKNADVAGVYTIGDQDAASSAVAIDQAGASGKVKLGGMNLSAVILDNIKAGKQAFAIDQQGYLQGYLAVSILSGTVNYGLSVPTRNILTGPGIVDSANVDSTIAGVKAGAR